MTDSPHLKRRSLIKGLAATSLIPLLGSNLIACSDGSDQRFDDIAAAFLHGIASGDPLADGIILWTRLTPETDGVIRVLWELAMDPDFNDIVEQGSGTTSAEVDYTVKVDVRGLAPNSHYYYRFRSGDAVSAVGRTRTLPDGAVTAASFAVVSCSNYPAGYFHVYKEVANREVDAVLHLGDYLYEYPSDGYASEDAEELGRVVEPPTELLSLDDYRTRYAQYRGDPDLQSCHARHPFIIVWDDHEVANDAWREGAENHQPESEGDFDTRKMEAIQAWYEWLPVRPPQAMEEIIYRRFQYGDLLDLLMLDTRIIGRDEQNTYADFATDGMIDVDSARATFGDSDRTLLGEEQLGWLREELGASSARWQVLGQQVLLGRYWLPAPIMEALDPSLSGPDIEKGTEAVFEALAAKTTLEEERSPEQQALLDSAIPYNLDAWDGYQYERDQLLAYARDLEKRLIVLAGDTHNAWTSQLTTLEGDVAGVEFGGTSVSSPGRERELGAEAAALFDDVVVTLVDDLQYSNLINRGYLHLEVTPEQAVATHLFIDTVKSQDYSVDDTLTRRFAVDRSDLVVRQVT